MKRERSEEERMLSRIFGKEITLPDDHEMTPEEAALVERVERKIAEIFTPELEAETRLRILRGALKGLERRAQPPKTD